MGFGAAVGAAGDHDARQGRRAVEVAAREARHVASREGRQRRQGERRGGAANQEPGHAPRAIGMVDKRRMEDEFGRAVLDHRREHAGNDIGRQRKPDEMRDVLAARDADGARGCRVAGQSGAERATAARAASASAAASTRMRTPSPAAR